MTWLFPALSLLCTYGMVSCAYWGFFGGTYPVKWLLYGSLPLTGAVLALCVVNLVRAVRACRGAGWEETLRLSRIGMVWKLLAVPYYLLNFAAWVMAGVMGMFPGMQFLGLLLPLAAAATYLPLLTSSAYTVAAIVCAKRQGRRIGLCHILWQLLFLTDLVDAIWLYCSLRKTELKKEGVETNGSL